MTKTSEDHLDNTKGQADAPHAATRPSGIRVAAHDCNGRRHFTLTTLYLRTECYPHLMKTPMESIAYCTGVRCGDTTVIDQLVTFRMNVQSVAYVSGDPMSTSTALIMMDDLGYFLEGTIHCHPGAGRDATTPSLIDHRHHRRLEAAGYKALGIIMTRDGHVRFYTDRMPFVVDVIGNDVVKLDDTNYRLILPHSGIETATESNKLNQEGGYSDADDDDGDTSSAAVCEGDREADASGAGPAGIPDGSSGEGSGVQAERGA